MKPTAFGISLAMTAVLATIGSGDTAIAQNPASTALIIQGGTLIDGNGGAPVPNSVIRVEGNRITAVGRAGPHLDRGF